MDGLFNYVKLVLAAHDSKALVCGVARINGRGIPWDVLQEIYLLAFFVLTLFNRLLLCSFMDMVVKGL